ncbi:hypothetical protein [Rickettsiella endosymbiont of Xylota segnis]|uniref:portal protein n=1 Tax=Rickettsiella endosymbiont of Xylota segnis TaxID=3066238 RepID=UPI0030CDF6DF
MVDQLTVIKKNIEKSCEYFQENVKRFNYFRQFVFQSSLSEADKAVLHEANKPILEFNSLEAFISRLRGEFSKQEPSIAVRLLDQSGLDPNLPLILEGHLRSIFDEANHNGCSYEVYTDILSGGFSAMKVWTEYQHEKSFDQVIKIGRVFDPTLVGFDPLAALPHKGDGRYCFELIPKTKEEFQKEYPDIDLSTLKFSSNLKGFNWSYQNQQEKILLLCDYYVKKKKSKKLLRLSNGHTLLSEDYKKLKHYWQEIGRLDQIPTIIEERSTSLETINRYRLIESTVLSHEETSYQFLPIVYVDGNSIRLSNHGQTKQVTRPYVYHAVGNQKLKNFAGQCLANELENMVMHKWKVAAEAIPEKYLEAYINPQKASVLVYNAFQEGSQGTIPLPPPQEVGRVSAPPEIIQTFTSSDATMQSILGSYDASLGINNNQLSGVAIVEGATQSNAAAMPYVVSFLQSLNQVAQIIIDLIPKYYVTSRTLPITYPDGKRGYAFINQQGGIDLKYRSEQLEVSVSAGVNFAIQKSRALQQIIALMQASPLFAQFINTEGLPILLDNLEIRGIDQLKAQTENFVQQLKSQQQQQMNQPNPLQEKINLEKSKLAAQLQENQLQHLHKTVELNLTKDSIDTNRMKLMADIQMAHNQNLVQLEKAQTERLAKEIEWVMKKS